MTKPTDGTPWCDTCHHPAVFHETWGWVHSTAEHEYGVPKTRGQSDHEVTARQWWNTPFFGRGSETPSQLFESPDPNEVGKEIVWPDEG